MVLSWSFGFLLPRESRTESKRRHGASKLEVLLARLLASDFRFDFLKGILRVLEDSSGCRHIHRPLGHQSVCRGGPQRTGRRRP